MMGHLVNHINNHDLRSNNTLHVIGVISNSQRYHSRYRIARQWMEHIKGFPCVELHMVELAYGDRKFEITDFLNPNHLQLRTSQEIWHKENMINLAVKYLLPKDWQYMAWIDCDVFFRDDGWAQETIQQLQHYPVVQPWSECLDLGYYGNVLQLFKSFCYIHRLGVKKQTHPSQPYQYAHSGFAWACTRYFYENVKGLMDFPILGSADHHQAFAMTGHVDQTVHGEMSDDFKRRCKEWQDLACKVTYGDFLGFVKGRIEHQFHGPKARRRYRERWQILIDNKFNPDLDLSYDSQGLLVLTKEKPRLIEECRAYMRQRAEDSIEEY